MTTRPSEGGKMMRGRRFTPAELDLIKKLVERFYDEGRTRVSEEICRSLDWRQPNGWLKDRACRDVLLRLEEGGFLSLPPRKANPAGNQTRAHINRGRDYSAFDGVRASLDLGNIHFKQVKGSNLEEQWNALVANHHYLGFRVAVGRTLKYLVEDLLGPVAALSFSDPAWTLKSRDILLSEIGWTTDVIRRHGISNNRFVIFPWARIPNLASAVLGRAIPHLRRDWLSYYGTAPRYIETFVDSRRFEGTCYRAANWFEIGETRGFQKRGRHHSNSQAPKKVMIYPIGRKLRRSLSRLLL